MPIQKNSGYCDYPEVINTDEDGENELTEYNSSTEVGKSFSYITCTWLNFFLYSFIWLFILYKLENDFYQHKNYAAPHYIILGLFLA